MEGKGWTGAGELKEGDKLTLITGERVSVQSVVVERCRKPVKIYNFEVEDFHTYYVGHESVLVHNMCDLNKFNHIFGKSEHKLSGLLQKFKGNQEKAYKAVLNATKKYIKRNNINGMFKDIVVNVKGYKVYVRGNVVNGVVKIGTFL